MGPPLFKPLGIDYSNHATWINAPITGTTPIYSNITF